MFNKTTKEFWILLLMIIVMATYFIIASPVLMDDGSHYERFTESLAKGKLDFKSFYGFQGLSILSVPIFWLTGSRVSIIITSAILYLLSLLLAYVIGRDYYQNKKAGTYFMILILLMPYIYTTMMRGFQEAALLFFILLTIYGAVNKKIWTPVAWAVGGIVKPFALILFPLFVKDFIPKSLAWSNFNITRSNLVRIGWVLVALTMGAVYLGASYYQTGHLVNNAAINSYQGNFDTGNPPPLIKSFGVGIKGFLRIGANLFLHYRKILLSPLVIILGSLVLLRFKELRLRREIILAILLNIFLVGSLTFSFSKYLLPMVVLLALTSVGYLLKYKWLIIFVLLDSYFVFMPIWDYFGHSFWGNAIVYCLPLYSSVFMVLLLWKKKA